MCQEPGMGILRHIWGMARRSVCLAHTVCGENLARDEALATARGQTVRAHGSFIFYLHPPNQRLMSVFSMVNFWLTQISFGRGCREEIRREWKWEWDEVLSSCSGREMMGAAKTVEETNTFWALTVWRTRRYMLSIYYQELVWKTMELCQSTFIFPFPSSPTAVRKHEGVLRCEFTYWNQFYDPTTRPQRETLSSDISL